MKSEPQNLARKTPLGQNQVSDTSLNGAGYGSGYVSSYNQVVADHPVYAPSAGLPNDMITARGLNPNDTAGAVAKPSFGGGMPDNIIPTMSADTTNSETNGTANPQFMAGVDRSDRSQKWAGGSQDVPAKGRNQYDTPQ